MIVYRLCKQEEYEEIFKNHDFTNVGYHFSPTSLNTHNYSNDKRYLHFFSHFLSIFYLRTQKDRYFCVYDIPDDILEHSKGIGQYWDYFNYEKLHDVEEYAVDVLEMQFEFLKQVRHITEDIDPEDDLYSELFDLGEIVYDSGEQKKLVLNKPNNESLDKAVQKYLEYLRKG